MTCLFWNHMSRLMSPLWLRLPSPCLWTVVLWKPSPPLKLCHTGHGAERVVAASWKELYIYAKSLQTDWIFAFTCHIWVRSCQSMDWHDRDRPVGDGQRGSQHSGLASSSSANAWGRKETPLYPQNGTAGGRIPPCFCLLAGWRNMVSCVQVIRSEFCVACGRRTKFGKICLRCQDCRAVAHPECRDRCPTPCSPITAGTPMRTTEVQKSEFCVFSTPSAFILDSVEI